MMEWGNMQECHVHSHPRADEEADFFFGGGGPECGWTVRRPAVRRGMLELVFGYF